MNLVEINAIRNKAQIEATRTKKLMLELCSEEEIKNNKYFQEALK